jgi:hypothetical protein
MQNANDEKNSERRHPERARFHQRAEGSPAPDPGGHSPPRAAQGVSKHGGHQPQKTIEYPLSGHLHCAK